MSGGSFNYLLDQYSEDLINRRQDLEKMAEALARDFPDSIAAADTARLADDISDHLRNIEERAQALREVWHGMEWWHSGDFGRDSAEKRVRDYDRKASTTDDWLIGGLRQLMADEALRQAPGRVMARRVAALLEQMGRMTDGT